MRDDGVDPAAGPGSRNGLGPLMRRDREARALRQADVADALHVERSNVSQIETGTRLPSLDYLHRWQALYGPNPAVQDAYQAAAERHDAQVSTRKARRDAASPPSPPGAGADDPGAATAIIRALSDSARASVQLAWKLWHTEGDAAALDDSSSVIERLEQAVVGSAGELRRHALTLLGDAHEAMGRRAFDRLRYTDAIGHFREMQELGVELADGELTTLAMLHLGDVARRRRRYATALSLLSASEPYARSATATTTTTTTTTTQGRRWQVLARTHAECGQRSPFLRAIDHAEACANEAGAPGPDLAADFTATQVRLERAHGLTLLGEARTALAIYEAESALAFRGVRDRASFLIIKAQALAHGGSLDEGVRLAIEGLDLARGYGSPRHVARVQRMHDRLRRTVDGSDPRLAMLRDALAVA